MQQTFTPIAYERILQYIAIQIPKLVNFSNTAWRNLAEIMTYINKYTKEGATPREGVYADNGNIFIGNYSSAQWNSTSVCPFHQEIIKAQTSDKGKSRGFNSRSQKQHKNKMQRAHRKLSKLKYQVEALEKKKRNVSAVNADTPADKESTVLVVHESDSQAGAAFGGKSAKRPRN